MEMSDKSGVNSMYFSINPIAEDIYVLIEKEGGESGSNSAIIDLGDKSVIFDTLLNIDAALELKAVCIKLTGREPDYVINSHSHLDHVLGNQVFGRNTIIISSHNSRELMIRDKRELESGPAADKNSIAELERALAVETDKDKIENIKSGLMYLRNLSRPGISMRLPDITFDKELCIRGEKRELRLISAGDAHSCGDIYAVLEKDRICFAGDLLFNNRHPWLGSGDPESLIVELKKLLQYKMDCYVPGHGDISGCEDINLLIGYVEEMIRLVESGGGVGDWRFSVQQLSPVYWDWKGNAFMRNINFLINKNRN